MSRLYARFWAALTDRFVLSQEDIDALVAERVASRPRD